MPLSGSKMLFEATPSVACRLLGPVGVAFWVGLDPWVHCAVVWLVDPHRRHRSAACAEPLGS